MKDTLKQRKTTNASNPNAEIRTNTQLWEAAIEYYADEYYDTEAMTKIYRRINPRITYQDIADTISAVYADTYWTEIQMDPSILSKSMVQALGLSPVQADLYARNAMKQWRGSLSRNNLADTGQIPSQGAYSQSIDIVCNQNTQLEPDQLINNWNNEFWKKPTVGKNYIYVRVQNKAFKGDLTSKAQMFFTQGGFNHPPSSWIQCLTIKDGSQEGEILLSDNKPGVLNTGDRGASEGFYFTPKGTDHVCIIAAVNDQYFTLNTPLSLSDSNWNSTTWLTHNGAAVWHNVNPQTTTVTRLKVYNQDGTNEKFVLNAQCRNVPVGSKVIIETNDKKFNSGEIIINKSSQYLETEAELPGYYDGDLNITIEGPNGELLAKNAAIEFTLMWKLNKGHDYYSRAAIIFDKSVHLLNDQAILTSLGSYTISGE
ncbi:MAG: hypothetical protein AB8B80_04630 [Marinicellaceae bacterium]